MVRVTRRFTFSAGHRLSFHKGGCQALHGHNYVLEVTFQRKDVDLDEHFMVVDFHYISEVINRWLKEHWDHALILSNTDIKGIDLLGSDSRISQIPGEPTAENMASILFYSVIPRLIEDQKEVKVSKVEIWETENSKATVDA